LLWYVNKQRLTALSQPPKFFFVCQQILPVEGTDLTEQAEQVRHTHFADDHTIFESVDIEASD
jgi:hypothetical protein